MKLAFLLSFVYVPSLPLFFQIFSRVQQFPAASLKPRIQSLKHSFWNLLFYFLYVAVDIVKILEIVFRKKFLFHCYL